MVKLIQEARVKQGKTGSLKKTWNVEVILIGEMLYDWKIEESEKIGKRTKFVHAPELYFVVYEIPNT